nr:cytochrome c oxidase polypeptide 5, mitochondrial [Quercus suber]
MKKRVQLRTSTEEHLILSNPSVDQLDEPNCSPRQPSGRLASGSAIRLEFDSRRLDYRRRLSPYLSTLFRVGKMMRTTPLLRALPTTSRLTATRTIAPLVQARHAHAISNPTLANIEKRWDAMPPQEQADLWMALRDRMKTDWNELTLQEKKAAYWIAFGPHGPRALPPPGENTKIFLYTMIGVGAAAVIFGVTRSFAREPPRTMTKEWQEASNEYLKVRGIPTRRRTSSLSLVYQVRVTMASVWCRASPVLHKRTKVTLFAVRNRKAYSATWQEWVGDVVPEASFPCVDCRFAESVGSSDLYLTLRRTRHALVLATCTKTITFEEVHFVALHQQQWAGHHSKSAMSNIGHDLLLPDSPNSLTACSLQRTR